MKKIPEGLTVKVTTNVRESTMKILAYRKGGFKWAYKATIPMCVDEKCRRIGPHSELRVVGRRYWDQESACTLYHRRDVDVLVSKIVKSYC
jgi:hypothetical protein